MASRRPKPRESRYNAPLPPPDAGPVLSRRSSKQTEDANTKVRNDRDKRLTSDTEPSEARLEDDPRSNTTDVPPQDTWQYKKESIPEYSEYEYGSSKHMTTDKPPAKSETILSPSLPIQSMMHKPAAQQHPLLSQPLREFLSFPLRDYKKCERYCRENPGIWNEDVDELRKLSVRYLGDGKDESARRCAERWLIVSSARHRNLSFADANAYVKRLVKDDETFQKQLDQLLEKLGREIDSNDPIDPVSPAPSSSKPAAGYVAPFASTRGPHAGSAVVFTQGSGVANPPRSSRRTSDASRQLQPKSLPFHTRQNEPQDLNQHLGPSHMPSQSTTLDSRKRSNEPRAPSQQQNTPDTPAPDPDVDDTVDDNITVHNREAQISGQKAEAGPRPDSFDDDFEYRDILHASFKLRTSHEAEDFFVKGRVFAMVWHENVGSQTNLKATEISESLDRPFHRHTRNKDGIVIFSHIRHFVIVKARPRDRYCWALPINTYGGHGLTKKNMRNEEKQAHAIIHASGQDPVRIKGEMKLNKQPISVEMAHGEKLKPASRLHFGKMQSIEWNIKVKDVGMITDTVSIRRLTSTSIKNSARVTILVPKQRQGRVATVQLRNRDDAL